MDEENPGLAHTVLPVSGTCGAASRQPQCEAYKRRNKGEVLPTPKKNSGYGGSEGAAKYRYLRSSDDAALAPGHRDAIEEQRPVPGKPLAWRGGLLRGAAL